MFLWIIQGKYPIAPSLLPTLTFFLMISLLLLLRRLNVEIGPLLLGAKHLPLIRYACLLSDSVDVLVLIFMEELRWRILSTLPFVYVRDDLARLRATPVNPTHVGPLAVGHSSRSFSITWNGCCAGVPALPLSRHHVTSPRHYLTVAQPPLLISQQDGVPQSETIPEAYNMATHVQIFTLYKETQSKYEYLPPQEDQGYYEEDG